MISNVHTQRDRIVCPNWRMLETWQDEFYDFHHRITVVDDFGNGVESPLVPHGFTLNKRELLLNN